MSEHNIDNNETKDPSGQSDEKSNDKGPKKRASWVSWASFLGVFAVVYFANVEVRSYLGRKALANTGLESISLNEALQKAQAENKLVLADMSAIWCPTCRKLDKEVLSNNGVKLAIDEKYVFSRIEYESAEGEAFMEKYGVRGFPTLLILDAAGNKIRQLALTFDPDQFVSQL